MEDLEGLAILLVVRHKLKSPEKQSADKIITKHMDSVTRQTIPPVSFLKNIRYLQKLTEVRGVLEKYGYKGVAFDKTIEGRLVEMVGLAKKAGKGEEASSDDEVSR